MSSETKVPFTDQVFAHLDAADGFVSADTVAEALGSKPGQVTQAFKRLEKDSKIRLNKEGDASAIGGEITEVIRSRKARSSGSMIEFCKTTDGYALRSEHGTIMYGAKRAETARQASTPEKWCPKCAEIVQARQAERDAKATAKAAKPAAEEVPTEKVA